MFYKNIVKNFPKLGSDLLECPVKFEITDHELKNIHIIKTERLYKFHKKHSMPSYKTSKVNVAKTVMNNVIIKQKSYKEVAYPLTINNLAKSSSLIDIRRSRASDRTKTSTFNKHKPIVYIYPNQKYLKYQKLKNNIEKNIDILKQKYLVNDEIKMKENKIFESVINVSKQKLINQIQEQGKHKLLTKQHIRYIIEEFKNFKLARDFNFLDKVIGSFGFLSKLTKDSRFAIFKEAKFEEKDNGSILYNKGDPGNVIYYR